MQFDDIIMQVAGSAIVFCRPFLWLIPLRSFRIRPASGGHCGRGTQEIVLPAPSGDAAVVDKAMARLHDYPDLFHTLAERGCQCLERNLTVEPMVGRTLAVYNQALQRGAA